MCPVSRLWHSNVLKEKCGHKVETVESVYQIGGRFSISLTSAPIPRGEMLGRFKAMSAIL